MFTNASRKFVKALQSLCKHARARFKKGPETPMKALSPEAQRALAEADERRKLADEAIRPEPAPKEIGGPKGPEPTRYGDWENKGITSDF
jgi:hypothetical protein